MSLDAQEDGRRADLFIVSAPAGSPFRRMRLRYAGTCRECHVALPAGQVAVYFRLDKQVECVECFEQSPHSDAPVLPREAPPLTVMSSPVASAGVVELLADDDLSAQRNAEAPVEVVLEAGIAGASARREHERRVAKREKRIRAAHPRLGGLILAVTDEPQSTRAWQRGAVGEEKLARSLDALVGRGVRALHDRRIPGGRANIAHIVIAPAGVFVIDAKRYKGRPSLRVEGGIIRARVEKLMVGGRDCTNLLTGIRKQVDRVTAALAADCVSEVPPVRGMLCFVDADWPVFGGAFTISDIGVLWPKKIAEHVLASEVLTEDQVRAIHGVLADYFPPA